MQDNKNIFYKKKILIYGLGKTGLSAYKFLKKKNELYFYDDLKVKNINLGIKKKIIDYKKVFNYNFDHIIISPGINIHNCKISNFLKKNIKKINTDLDIFFSMYSTNRNITITGTNGKSTTATILYEVLREQKIDVRLVGNIGKPILLEKNITNKTIFVIEASSYQLEYSSIFKSNFAAILNISPDHLERHGTLKKYIKAKFKLIEKQNKKDYAILNINNHYIKNYLKSKNFLTRIVLINKKIDIRILKEIDNPYFESVGNKENLLFVLKITKILRIKKKNLFKVLKNFNGLRYRQEIIYKNKNLTIINDSKATSFSSSVSILQSLSNTHWIVGGVPKKNDKFLLPKKNYKNLKVYIFGKNKKVFIKKLKNIIPYESFLDLKTLIKKIFLNIKLYKIQKHQIILFSPAAASFDDFKNFEERGEYFNNLIKKNINVK